MCAFSIGTETDGSIMFPADRNAVVGIKPTVGLTSTLGVIPESPSMDTVGTFGRSVEDATIILDIIADRNAISGHHANYPGPRPATESSPEPYTDWLSKQDALRGARFGLPWTRVWEAASKNANRKVDYTVLRETIKQLEKAGAQVIEVDFPSAEEIISPDGWDWEFEAGETGSALSEFEVVRTEFYRSLRSYLSGLTKNEKGIHSLEDIVAYNVQHTEQEGGVAGTHPAWPTGQDNFDRCLKSRDRGDDIYHQALEYIRWKSREEGIDAAMAHGGNNLDGLLVPLQADAGVACSVAAKAGYPMITVPIGVDGVGVPFGIGIMGTAWKEHLLVKYASAIEDLVGRRKRPTFLNLDAENYTYVALSQEADAFIMPVAPHAAVIPGRYLYTGEHFSLPCSASKLCRFLHLHWFRVLTSDVLQDRRKSSIC
jgi:amidase